MARTGGLTAKCVDVVCPLPCAFRLWRVADFSSKALYSRNISSGSTYLFVFVCHLSRSSDLASSVDRKRLFAAFLFSDLFLYASVSRKTNKFVLHKQIPVNREFHLSAGQALPEVEEGMHEERNVALLLTRHTSRIIRLRVGR